MGGIIAENGALAREQSILSFINAGGEGIAEVALLTCFCKPRTEFSFWNDEYGAPPPAAIKDFLPVID